MARKPIVSRKFTECSVTLKYVDVDNEKICTKEVIVPRKQTDKSKLLKLCKKMFETEKCKILDVVEFTNCQTLRGMSEETFIEHSVLLNPETRKPYKVVIIKEN